MLPRAGTRIPTHRQAPFRGDRLHVGATLAVDRDAVVAEGDRADDGFTRQRTAAATQPVIQPLDPEDGPLADATALPVRTGIPLRHKGSRQFLIRGRRHLTFRQ